MLCILTELFMTMVKPFLFSLSYISSNISFPQPLTPEEEEMYLERYEQGDEEARNVLVERNLRLVAHIVKKYGNIGCDVDDLISIGTIGLIKGITTFDRNKGTRLATYAARCIENEILMTIRASKKIKTEVSLQDPIGVDREGNEISLIDILGTEPDEVLNEVELKMQVKKLYKKMASVLKKRELMVLELRYGISNGGRKTQREIAKLLGISRSYVSRIEKRAIKKLYKSFDMKE
ncbi:RNA polymerase sporulation sigma factor SigK [Clostridium formicaceticum]|uniref:RNA polymerase sigma factor n=1 Tax=Clostridium formicaceticum TaxID=1497 RepID=A0AAC9WG51_9CLOT|nr:RNA polymerase sporulation sigma factor SigK [Clostridium formicaceticum]AOY77038.1 sporulation sigma factor SigK [Clostridium formicaceticum]ARE87538.1 RNA polymerase sigma-28 factor precursor [Clostridium formicaceticum]